MSEIGATVVWPNFAHKAEWIGEKLAHRFEIIDVIDIEWSKELIFDNFYRFYGDRLSTSSIKEKSPGYGKARLFVFKDCSPARGFRTNARGIEKVNTNFFDFKQLVREKLNTKFGIHGTNDLNETNRDLCMLLGKNLEDFIHKKTPWDSKVKHLQRDITGAEGWSNTKELFYFLNAVGTYAVLRNDELIPNLPDDEDIDFLVNDREKFAYFINAEKQSKGCERANYTAFINHRAVDIDLRYVGDCYFDPSWQRNCILNRRLNDDSIYCLDEENAYYTLLYHALIHKKEFPQKYLDRLKKPEAELRTELYEFMHQNHYLMVEPKDVTLNFNRENGGNIKFSRARKVRLKKGFSGVIKKVAYKLNNLARLKRGPA